MLKNTIANLRRKKGIKQYDLARALHVSPSYLCKIEKGIIEPTEKFMKDCAKCLKVHQEDLLLQDRNGNNSGESAGKGENILWSVRKEKGIKQYSLARMIGCSPSYLSKVEKGLQQPNAQFKKKCAKVLRVKEILLFPL